MLQFASVGGALLPFASTVVASTTSSAAIWHYWHMLDYSGENRLRGQQVRGSVALRAYYWRPPRVVGAGDRGPESAAKLQPASAVRASIFIALVS